MYIFTTLYSGKISKADGLDLLATGVLKLSIVLDDVPSFSTCCSKVHTVLLDLNLTFSRAQYNTDQHAIASKTREQSYSTHEYTGN